MKNMTLLIPTYNEGTQLKKTVTFFQKNFPGLKLIVVDDGSTDRSIDQIINFDNILVIQNKENLGKSLAIKIGLSHVTTEWVCLFDADLRGLTATEIAAGFVKSKNENIDMVVFEQVEDPLICKWLKLNILLSGERCIKTKTLRDFFETENPYQYAFEIDFHNWLIKQNKKIELSEMHSKNRLKLSKWSPPVALKKSWSFYSYLLFNRPSLTSLNESHRRLS